MRFYFRYILIFLIINNKWVLVQSDDTSATPPASSGGDGTTAKIGQDASATSPTAGSTDSGTKTGVELSLKKTSGTNEFDYNKDGNTVTYTAKDKYAFKSVKTGKNGDIVVWSTTNASEYATKVVLNGKGKKQKEVTIHLPNNTTKVFDRSAKGKPWNEVKQTANDSSKQTPVTLNVDSVKDSDYYTCKVEQGVRTFTPKEGFVFNEVNSGGSVWKATKEDEYANKVEYLALKCVWIYLPNNVEKTFRYAGNNQWVDTQASTQKSSTDGSGGTDQSSGGTTGTDGSGGTDQSGGGTTGTGGSGGGTASKPATQ
ncbi:hypothetical protein MACK_001091 [Theileria orientalis]|uniref:Uncharacterized protein n=1 Tax=Theileria orientalis TaxID=68886 RepID=A0A976QVD3_THEOR|nr:hypothetical protein MACK_001091 [Theileria orientalis]